MFFKNSDQRFCGNFFTERSNSEGEISLITGFALLKCCHYWCASLLCATTFILRLKAAGSIYLDNFITLTFCRTLGSSYGINKLNEKEKWKAFKAAQFTNGICFIAITKKDVSSRQKQKHFYLLQVLPVWLISIQRSHSAEESYSKQTF